ncbi:hypothetical protein [Winogradskya humida]|uniref:Uncharacterized protein n=1 Tax=Winogradskya humida TaxID=113566 RepID=A0ABQ3ZYM5_9ACTN|nr:hypothetical protein [Actinoplanes humidus]GIE23643.1 hypothetical protein Ahu01nite_067450 [Actinoplanes humidus]
MTTVYRFLPWTRRGLSAALPDPPAGGSIPARAQVTVTVTIDGAGAATTQATVLGPGDVTGIDPAQIVRTFPRPETTNAEPNYLAAIDLDAPELPWLFTPHGVPADGRLPPWLVLVVVEDRDGVTVTAPRGAPLPQLSVTGAGDELPDLDESWAWAHVQLIDTAGTAGPAADLAARPDHNVARLICPRRLIPGRRWIAALVPAFDAGRIRGMGGVPGPAMTLDKAWSPKQDTVVLPMYFHWRFQTGIEGDFESLAQRLRPHRIDAQVGRTPMDVGDAAPPLRITGEPAVMSMDGVLRAPLQSTPSLHDTPERLRAGLAEITRTLADAADGVLDGQALEDASRQPVGPPVYAGAHVQRWSVRDRVAGEDAEWFRELNLDPRSRVAAGLGAECVRDNQEDLVDAAWQQAGDVLTAEAALQRAALTTLVTESFYRRHVLPMTDGVLLGVMAPAARRTPVGKLSLVATVAASSMPDATVDAGLRRALAPSGRAVARAARRLRVVSTALRPTLVAKLAVGHPGLDATRFARPTLTGIDPTALTGTTLAAFGLPLEVGAEAVQSLAACAQKVAAARTDQQTRLTVRTDLHTVGLLAQTHVDAARTLAAETVLTVAGTEPTGTVIETIGSGALLDALTTGVAATADRGVGMLLEGPVVRAGTLTTPMSVGVLDIDAGNTLVLRTGVARQPVAVLDPGVATLDLGGFLSRLPVNVIRRSDSAHLPGVGTLPVLRPAVPFPLFPGGARPGGAFPGGPIVIGKPPVVIADPVVVIGTPVTAPAGAGTTVAVPALITDPRVITLFETAMTAQKRTTAIAVPPPVATVVAYDLAGTAAAIKQHLLPSVAQPLRRDAMIRFAGKGIGEFTAAGQPFTVDGWWATRGLDRVMTYPVLARAGADLLTGHDRTRFCPGVDTVPPDSVTVLETNPRFVAAFMAGLNHEMNRELLFRGFPADGRGTPLRRFWRRLDGRDDIAPIHGWRTGNLAGQTIDTAGNLVLMLRGDLLRRYPNTVVLAVPALDARRPDRARTVAPIFQGQFDPDVSYFGFPLPESALTDGAGLFFALMEPLTEPRFGLDETKNAEAGAGALSWSDTPVAPGAHLRVADAVAPGVNKATARADTLAATLFQQPFALYVHASHLLAP